MIEFPLLFVGATVTKAFNFRIYRDVLEQSKIKSKVLCSLKSLSIGTNGCERTLLNWRLSKWGNIIMLAGKPCCISPCCFIKYLYHQMKTGKSERGFCGVEVLCNRLQPLSSLCSSEKEKNGNQQVDNKCLCGNYIENSYHAKKSFKTLKAKRRSWKFFFRR